MVRPLWAAAVVAVALLSVVQADFNAATGFSGRFGFDCTVCHTPPPVDLFPAATLQVEGVPDAWDVGTTYPLTVTMLGGPPAAPAPMPQGGFEADTDNGRFTVAAGMEAYTRNYADQAVTYTPEGALRRSWDVDWTAPDLRAPPAAANLWIAGLAANGNHVVALGQEDGGELLDLGDHAVFVVPPSDGALDAWQAIPLLPPVVASVVPQGDGWTVAGMHGDGNATTLRWRLDGGLWTPTDTAAEWTLTVDAGRTLELQSLGSDRRSDVVAVALGEDGWWSRNVPAPALVPVGLLVVALAARTARFPEY